MDIISLGIGFHDLESTPNYTFRWTQDTFSIYLEQNLTELELFVSCNKRDSDCYLNYSTDNWKTQTSISLQNDVNNILINVKNVKKIDFKTSTFVPSIISKSPDNRTLGIQLRKIYCVDDSDKCYEIDISEIQFRNDLVSKMSIDKPSNSFCVVLINGWHDLENNLFRWTTGHANLGLNNHNFDIIKFLIGSNSNCKLTVLRDDENPTVFELKEGKQEIVLQNIKTVKKITFINEPFTPVSTNRFINDDRKLGIQLFSVEFCNVENTEILTVITKNIFSEIHVKPILSFFEDGFTETQISEINSNGHIVFTNFKHYDDGKLNLNNQLVFYTHRSGWSLAIDSIKPLHNDLGILFDGFLERTFDWNKYQNIKSEKIPIKTPWVGVIHNPMFSLFEKKDLFSTTKLLKSIIFRKSLETCKGLYVLSKDLKTKLGSLINEVPIEFLYLPTADSTIKFDWELFERNPNKRLLSIGSWMRRFSSIYKMDSGNQYKKTLCFPLNINGEKFNKMITEKNSGIDEEIHSNEWDTVETISYQETDKYDQMLSDNLVFMDFYDVSASNLVVECMIRNTPILIRKHNAVIDYLGSEYPFYFESLAEASEKVRSLQTINDTFCYLSSLDKTRLTKNYFRNSITEGEIYKNLKI